MTCEKSPSGALKASFFTCGWKPVLTWVCVLAFAWAYLIAGILEAVYAGIGLSVTLQKADSMPMFELVIALLGLGGIHSYDRKNGNIQENE